MTPLREWIYRLWATLRPSFRHDRELEQELRLHLELAADDARRRTGPAAARAAAIRAGGITQTMDALRDQRSLPLLDDLARDVRHGFRFLRRNPAFAGAAVISLALGIGANSAMFSIVDAELLRPLPVPDPGAVVTVSAAGAEDRGSGVSYPNYRDLREASGSFDGLIAYQRSALMTFARSSGDVREVRMGMLVSDNFFAALRVGPAIGRLFAADEGRVPGRDPVAVLGYDFWKNVLAGDPSIVNRVVWINGVDFTVIGVVEERFTGMDESIPSLFVPAMMAGRLGARENLLDDRTARSFAIKGRLKSGVSRRKARAELTTLWEHLEKQYPDANQNRTISVRGQLEERIQEEGPATTVALGLMMALVIVVLLIACANVAGLMLGRSRARAHEVAICLALGVSRSRLLRQLLIESLLLALLGCVIGLGLAFGGLKILRVVFAPPDLRIVVTPHLDQRVLIVSILAALASALLSGLPPALQSLKTQLVPALKDTEPGQTSRRRMVSRSGLVVAQIAMSLVLLLVTGGMLDGFRKLQTASPGFRTDHLITMGLDTSIVRYTPSQTRDFFQRLGDRARTLPEVTSVALTSWIPIDRGGNVTAVVPEGYQPAAGHKSVSVFFAVVDDNYFDTMRIELLRGRPFRTDDKDGSRGVAIVNEEFAKTFWPGLNPIGKRLRLNDSNGPWLEVVGVTRTGKYLFVAEPPTRFLYLPFAQHERTAMSLLVETTSADAGQLAAPLRGVVRDLDVNLPVFNVRTFASLYQRRAVEIPKTVLQMIGTTGMIGLTLALVGLYGLVAYSVARRTREIGLRMAMGASRSDIVKMVIGQAFVLSAIGVVLGGLASVAVARMLASSMAGLGRPSTITLVVVPTLLICLTLAGSYLPARRASLVDPLIALRDE
jgi:macrolide transport system ATP-binding/permease protein